MGIIVMLILGGLIGWAASSMMGRQEGVTMSVIIGVVGSFVGSLLSELFTGADRSFLALSWTGLLWSFIGAVVLLAIVNAFTRPHHA
ncbi:MAG: GlsB/YeaQ/YmgE family stress response membrane protein [Candidatus Saccharimonadales bacterium]